jgi:hypothetical protein
MTETRDQHNIMQSEQAILDLFRQLAVPLAEPFGLKYGLPKDATERY